MNGISILFLLLKMCLELSLHPCIEQNVCKKHFVTYFNTHCALVFLGGLLLPGVKLLVHDSFSSSAKFKLLIFVIRYPIEKTNFLPTTSLGAYWVWLFSLQCHLFDY